MPFACIALFDGVFTFNRGSNKRSREDYKRTWMKDRGLSNVRILTQLLIVFLFIKLNLNQVIQLIIALIILCYYNRCKSNTFECTNVVT